MAVTSDLPVITKKDCSYSCLECRGPDDNKCISCRNGYYLLKDAQLESGTCLEKTLNTLDLTLYIKSSNDLSQGGSFSTFEYADLFDALAKALNEAAQYKEANINIYLYKGTHYTLRDFSTKIEF